MVLVMKQVSTSDYILFFGDWTHAMLSYFLVSICCLMSIISILQLLLHAIHAFNATVVLVLGQVLSYCCYR